eukprot:TRINITY_DN8305_c0_g1_i2.p1 TRINITY_DN8305_c0_g1~~TRINITY_DN8305_c0_g1_i2.p1  ORF type:complete len:1282 (+),score=257.43 TRINITY_DN8305_c0_g1_i2:71-3916(+)
MAATCCLPKSCEGLVSCSSLEVGAAGLDVATQLCKQLVSQALADLQCVAFAPVSRPPSSPSSQKYRLPELPGLVDPVNATPVEPLTWETWSYCFLWRPLTFMIPCLVIFPVAGMVYRRAYMRNPRFHRFMHTYIGTVDYKNPRRPWFLISLYVLQTILSTAFVGLWISRTYSQEDVSMTCVRFEELLCVFFAFCWFINAMKNGFSLAALLNVSSCIDMLTVLPVLQSVGLRQQDRQWFTLAYLRSFRALVSFQRLLDMKVGADLGRRLGIDLQGVDGSHSMAYELLNAALRFIALIICFAGTIMLFEILGEIPLFAEFESIKTEMGDISFCIVVYWIIETISTVGYGDYAPKTAMSRWTTLALMFTGVAFFGYETARLLDVVGHKDKGQGRFVKVPGQRHVVLIGGGVRYADDTLLLGFLSEILHQSHSNDWPHVVMMSVTNREDNFDEFLSLYLPWEARQKVSYFAGSPLNPRDLQRIGVGSADCVFVLADTMGNVEPAEEDSQNIFRTVSVLTNYPDAYVKLMLLLPDSKYRAFASGIPPTVFFCQTTLKTAMFWQSCRCRGWHTLLANLTMDATESTEQDFRGLGPPDDYCKGRSYQAYGFLPATRFVGRSVSDLVEEAYLKHHVLVIAVQMQGQIHLLPHRDYFDVKDQTVCFSICLDSTNLQTISRSIDSIGRTWEMVFRDSDARRQGLSGRQTPSGSPKKHTGGRTPTHMERALEFFQNQQAQLMQSLKTVEEEREGGFQKQLSNGTMTSDNTETTPCARVARKNARFANMQHSGADGLLEPLLGDEPMQMSFGGNRGSAAPTLPIASKAKDGASKKISLKPAFGGGARKQSSEKQGEKGKPVPANKTRQRGASPEENDGDEGPMLETQESDSLNDSEVQQLAEQAEAIRQNADDDPFILVVDLTGSWMQIVLFLKESFQTYLPDVVPIIISSSVRPTRRILRLLDLDMVNDPQIAFVQGDPLWVSNLVRAGVKEASVVACFGGNIFSANAEIDPREPQLLDKQVVMLSHALRYLGVTDMHDKTILLEFNRFSNVQLLTQKAWGEHHHRDDDWYDWEPGSPGSPTSPGSRRGKRGRLGSRGDRSFISRTFSSSSLGLNRLRPSSGGMFRDNTPSKSLNWTIEELMHNTRFASGEVFTMSMVFGAMLGRTFYVNGLIELMHALLMLQTPSAAKYEPATTFLWQIKVPGEIAGDFPNPYSTWGKLWINLWRGLHHESVIAVGLYRVDDEGHQLGNPCGYVVTNPRDDLPLNSTDLVFVLGSEEWGEWAHINGLLNSV